MKSKKEFNPTFPLFIIVVLIPWAIMFLLLSGCGKETECRDKKGDCKVECNQISNIQNCDANLCCHWGNTSGNYHCKCDK